MVRNMVCNVIRLMENAIPLLLCLYCEQISELFPLTLNGYLQICVFPSPSFIQFFQSISYCSTMKCKHVRSMLLRYLKSINDKHPFVSISLPSNRQQILFSVPIESIYRNPIMRFLLRVRLGNWQKLLKI